ncbi:MAG: GGDEF domain-containing protein [Proteobacteria bacterium]|nr:GGDEF domain-containing protein [Pseudomonadota bacterium]NOG59364.1 GGDEF domain-containing protein [Pseudomonadota bacterium]
MTISTEPMADITDISDSPGVQNSRLMVSYPENMTDVTNMSIHVMGVLQSTLELEKLIELFDDELAAVVPHDHLSYENKDEAIKYDIAKPARHRSTYGLVLFGKKMGELTISRNCKFVDAEVHKIESLISALIYPLRNALLYKQAVEKAYSDPLTGLNNRAAFDKSIEQEIDLAARHGHTLSLMMLDLDRFKQINDNYGHIVGDAVLKNFADCIMECMRRSDIAFRFGGEEFVVLLRNTQITGAQLLAERMRKKVEEMKFEYNSIKLNVSVSIGLAELKEGEDKLNLIERADTLLYKAKKNGRNRVEVENVD